jgi:hypothetical protein
MAFRVSPAACALVDRVLLSTCRAVAQTGLQERVGRWKVIGRKTLRTSQGQSLPVSANQLVQILTRRSAAAKGDFVWLSL